MNRLEMNEDVSPFLGGFVVSVLGNWGWILQTNFHPSDVALEWSMKIFSTMILGIIGGLAGMFSKDLYRWLKRNKKQ